jgi:cobalt-zinc-cadmium efflux system membrane fusion protein
MKSNFLTPLTLLSICLVWSCQPAKNEEQPIPAAKGFVLAPTLKTKLKLIRYRSERYLNRSL